MKGPLYIAVDLGAGSGRVFLCGLDADEMMLEEVRRFHYPPSRRDGHLRWDFPCIWAEIKAGLAAASGRARDYGRRVQSIGVDSWGVDYGLLDEAGRLLEDPICYRDERTLEAIDRVYARLSQGEIFARTGIQFLSFNTLFQLAAHVSEGLPRGAARLLLIPDLVNHALTGRAVTEYTNATTTQLVNAGTGVWDRGMIEQLGLPSRLLAEIVEAGTDLGPLKPELADELRLAGVRVVAPATHDTGSAVAGTPLAPGRAYISSGTWSLIGIELSDVLMNAEVARHNFTNEGGVCGTIRFLKNVSGLWILESCRREWQERGLETGYERLFAGMETEGKETSNGALIFPDDPRFLNPPSMLEAVARQLSESGQAMPDDPPAVARMILDSLALRYRSVLTTIESLTGRRIQGVQIVGGGSRNDYLNQATADAARVEVFAGPVEATVAGNALVQAIAAGRFASLEEARRHLAENVCIKRYTPRPSAALERRARRYAELEARFIN